MPISIVQFAPYVWPLEGPTPTQPNPVNIPLAANPTPGNLLIACVPLDYLDNEPVTLDPAWAIIAKQGYTPPPAEFTNVPMTWFARIVQPGDIADLPGFYDGFTGTEGANPFTAYIGGAVWELSGAAADLSALVQSYGFVNAPELNPPAIYTGSAAPAFTPDVAGSLALGVSVANSNQFPPPPWCGQTPDAEIVQDSYQRPEGGVSPAWDCVAVHQFIPTPVSTTNFDAGFPDADAILWAFAVIVLRPAASGPLPVGIPQIIAIQLPCVPCLQLPCGLPI